MVCSEELITLRAPNLTSTLTLTLTLTPTLNLTVTVTLTLTHNPDPDPDPTPNPNTWCCSSPSSRCISNPNPDPNPNSVHWSSPECWAVKLTAAARASIFSAWHRLCLRYHWMNGSAQVVRHASARRERGTAQ